LTLTPDHYEGGTIDQPTLMIKNSTRHDQGVYTCELGNKVGTQESNNAVYVAVYCELIVVLCNRKCMSVQMIEIEIGCIAQTVTI
jgi:hypothetical protein